MYRVVRMLGLSTPLKEQDPAHAFLHAIVEHTYYPIELSA